MGQKTGEIRHDIEQTRARMSATIEAIGYRLDVPARVRYRFSHIMQDIGGAFGARTGDGGEPGVMAKGEQAVGSLLHTAQEGAVGLAGALEERLGNIGRTIQSQASETPEKIVDRTTGENGSEGSVEQTREAARSTVREIGGFARNNVLALSLGAIAVGVVAGMLIARSRME